MAPAGNTSLPKWQRERPPKRGAVGTSTKRGQQRQGSSAHNKDNPLHASLPASIQQALLNVFVHAFPNLLNGEQASSHLPGTIQEIKGQLFDRNFDKAFGCEDYLEAYAVRWSPPRCLAYTLIFDAVVRRLELQGDAVSPTQKRSSVEEETATTSLSSDHLTSTDNNGLNVICLGGGAGAEIVALAGINKLRKFDVLTEEVSSSLNVELVDIADWHNVVNKLLDTITKPPPLSAYASAKAKANNEPLLASEKISTKFHQVDLLAEDRKAFFQTIFKADAQNIACLMFTLNELFSTSKFKTQRLLLEITATSRPGTLLLVVDSPGSYSTITFDSSRRGENESQGAGADQTNISPALEGERRLEPEQLKQYPMAWLLDYTLLKLAPNTIGHHTGQLWTKIDHEESCWFRLDKSLSYPIALEDMRYQKHIYRRV